MRVCLRSPFEGPAIRLVPAGRPGSHFPRAASRGLRNIAGVKQKDLLDAWTEWVDEVAQSV